MKKLLLTAIAALALVNPVQARTFADFKTLADAVEKTGTTVSINTDAFDPGCKGNKGYYAYKKDVVDVLAICEDRVNTEDPRAVWEVLAHEATHVAQACLGEDTMFKDGEHAMMIEELKKYAPHNLDLVVRGYDRHERLSEIEAFWMMLQPVEDVVEYFHKTCFR